MTSVDLPLCTVQVRLQ